VVALRVKRSALLGGLDPARLSGHSLRSGFITSAARHGASIWELADQSRHRSACGWRRHADEPAGLVRLYDTRRLGANRLLEAADGSEGLQPENAVHRPWVIP
jgi:hypothetical protein